MIHGYNRRVLRLVALGVFFTTCCVLFVIRLAVLQLNSQNIGGHPQDGTTLRTEIVQAVRGQIYDRNGVPLVTNAYTYDLTFDYALMPVDEVSRGQTILQALDILDACGESGKLTVNTFPLEGTYPHFVYVADAETPGTPMYDCLLEVIKSSGLRALTVQRLRVSEGWTRTKAQAVFDQDPLHYITADVLVKHFNTTYLLDGEDTKTKERYFTDAQADRLLRVYWGMEATGFSRANDYVLAKDVSMDTIVCEREWGVAGIGFTTTASRVYAYPGYASHILGQTGPIYAEDWPYYKELGYHMNATVGISGCEAAFEKYLHGQDGVRVVREDAQGRIVDAYMKSEAVAGQDIYLTIDIHLQIAAEDGLKENIRTIRAATGREDCTSGAAVAMDPSTGEVLAIASYPSFDLSTFSETYKTLVADPALPLYNRALLGLYAPGSTFKPGVAAAALSEGYITADATLECAGRYTYFQSYQPACWIYNSTTSATRKHGWIDVSEALRVSCNCYFYEVGRRMGIQTMNRYCTLYGLGLPTGIELGESSGILAGPDYREASHGVTWQATDTIAAAIGQSDNAFTPIQLASYLSTLSNGGTRYQAHLLSRVRDFTTQKDTLVVTPEVLSSFTLQETYRREILQAMESVVTTSSQIQGYMRRLPVSVAGKTGTAQTGGKRTDNGLFICCAPAYTPSSAPDVVVAVAIERAGGGSYAAMTAGRVLDAYYQK